MGAVQTMRIVSPKDPTRFRTINRSDFNPALHTPWPPQRGGDAAPHSGQPALHAPPEGLDSEDKEELQRMAREYGLQPDNRFGPARLRKMIMAHLQLQEN